MDIDTEVAKAKRRPIRRIKAISDAALGALLDVRDKKIAEAEKKPYWLARGTHTEYVPHSDNIVTVTEIVGIRPDRMSPAEKRARSAPAVKFHTIPIHPEVVTTINEKSGKPHTVVTPRLDGRRRPIVQVLTPGWQKKVKGHRSGVSNAFPPIITGHQRRMMRRYRAQYPTLDANQLMAKIVEDMIAKAKKLEARAAAA